MWTKIGNLNIQKKKSFWALVVICATVLLWGVLNLFGHTAVYYYGVGQSNINSGMFDEDIGAVYIDEAYGFKGSVVEFVGISLPRGVYNVQLSYETDAKYANLCEIEAPTSGYGALYSNHETLHPSLSSTGYNVWVMRDVAGINVNVKYVAGELLIGNLTIQETNDMQKMLLFAIVCGVIAVLGLYVYVQYNAVYPIRVGKKQVFFGLVTITLVASLPVMVDYIVNGGDTGFHINRIEGLKDGLLNRQFPVRIAPRWLEDNGYASPIFYCETMLLPAAFLRMLGFSVTATYRMYMFIINAVTAWVAYYSFSRMYKDYVVGLLCSMLHTLSVYRIFKMYMCGSFGEMLGILWLPLIVYGFYRVFAEDNKTESYKWSFLPLSIGYAGLIQSHMLSCELAGGFTVLLCIVMWRKVIQKETFMALAKAASLAAFVSAWFIVPFLDYMLSGNFVIHNVSGRTIQERGLLLAHFFMAVPFAGGNEDFQTNGMLETAPLGVGFALMVVLFAWAYFCVVFDRKRKAECLGKVEVITGNVLASFAVIAILMSLRIFPWNYLQSMNGVFATLISSIQFPNRFLTIATVLLVALAGMIVTISSKYRQGKYVIGGVLCGLTLFTSMYLLSDFMQTRSFVRIHNIEGMGFGYISGAEYLPYGADQNTFVFRNPTSSEEVIIDGYEKGSLSWDVNCYNVGSEEGHVVMPLLYYKGYQSWDADTGENLRTYQGDDFSVWVEVPEGYSGVIHTEFVSPWYWRVAELISVITVLSMVLLYRRDKKRLIMQKEA